MSPPQQQTLAPLDAECEASLCALICERTGIVVHEHQREKLHETIRGACLRFGHSDCRAFVEYLAANPLSTPEQEFLFGEITIGESYFFRDPRQIEFLREEWLPRTVAARRESGELSLRIWSAGCSGGQELYTVAMLLQEMIPDLEQWTLHLLGTDISTRALSHAIRGRFPKWSFRATPDEVRERYFRPEGRQWEIAPRLRKMVKFAYLNLRDDSFPSILTETHALDLILCRNVFIYFDRDAIHQVMGKFAAALAPHGYIQLGASDPLDPDTPDLDLCQHEDTFYFRRRGALPPEAAPEPERKPKPRPARRPPPAPPAAKRAARKPAPAPAPAPERAPKRAAPAGDSVRERYADIIELFREQRWDDAFEAVERHLADDGESAALTQFKAKTLANLGQLKVAAAMAERSLELDSLDKHTYLLLGMIRQELDQLEAAEAALRRALFLDLKFAEAHFQLGLLKLRRSERQAGLKSLHTALELLEEADPDRPVHNSEGMTCGRLTDILRTEISIYSRD